MREHIIEERTDLKTIARKYCSEYIGIYINPRLHKRVGNKSYFELDLCCPNKEGFLGLGKTKIMKNVGILIIENEKVIEVTKNKEIDRNIDEKNKKKDYELCGL